MRIAVPYENGNIFQHFGRSEAFKLYDVADGAVTAAAVVSTNGSGHGALAGFLVANHADVVICGGIGGGAQSALTEAGIRFYGGVSGSADAAARTRQCRRCLTARSAMIPRRAAIITTTRTAQATPAASTAAANTAATADDNGKKAKAPGNRSLCSFCGEENFQFSLSAS